MAKRDTFIRDVHRYVARYSVGPSVVRGQRAYGLVAAAQIYLATLPLGRFAVPSQAAFSRQLDRQTAALQAALPRGGRSWGIARKILNIFLRNAMYTGYLRDAYHLDVAERWYEIPLDSIVARQLRTEARGVLPRWVGVKYLTPALSHLYQAAAEECAARHQLARVHLDAIWWGGPRTPAA